MRCRRKWTFHHDVIGTAVGEQSPEIKFCRNLEFLRRMHSMQALKYLYSTIACLCIFVAVWMAFNSHNAAAFFARANGVILIGLAFSFLAFTAYRAGRRNEKSSN